MTKFAVTSCCHQKQVPVQPVWDQILAQQPDHALFLGDNIYAVRWKPSRYKKAYSKQFNEKHFKRFIDQVPFTAIWDDHDSGPNNVKGEGNEEKMKPIREEFLKWMRPDVPLDSPVYISQDFDNVRVIMLDVRSYRNSHRRPGATFLGSIQFDWFAEQLDHPLPFTLVCLGSCLNSGKERLSNYKDEYSRFVAAMKSRGNCIVATGDIHRNEFNFKDGVYEVVSSGVAKRKRTAADNNKGNYATIEFSDSSVSIEYFSNMSANRLKNVKLTLDDLRDV